MAHVSDYNETVETTEYRRKNVQRTPVWGVSPRVDGKLKLRPNAFYREKIKGSMTPCVYSWAYGSRTKAWQHYPQHSYADALEASVRNQAVAKFYSEVGGIKANLADAYRTRKETIDMVSNRLRQVVKAARAVRKGNFKRAQSIFAKGRVPKPIPKRVKKSRPFAENWLEWSYGWSPLLGDIYTLCNEPFPDINIQAKVTAIDSETYSFNTTQYTSFLVHEFTDVLVNTKCTMVSDVLFKDTAIKAAADLGLTNPAAVAWEAMPWSFVVDWVLPVGDWLESFTSLSGLKFRNLSTTMTSKIFVNGYWKANPRSGYWTNIHQPGTGSWVLDRKDRRTGGLPSYPLPSFENPFSINRALNAVALFRTNVR